MFILHLCQGYSSHNYKNISLRTLKRGGLMYLIQNVCRLHVIAVIVAVVVASVAAILLFY